MKKSILLPSLSVLVTILCFFLRKNQLNKAKNAETLLYTPMAGETILLLVVLLLYTIALAGLVFTGARSLPNYRFMVYCPSQIFLISIVVAGFLLVLSTCIGLMDIFSVYTAHKGEVNFLEETTYPFPFGDILLAVGCGLSGATMLFLGRNANNGDEAPEGWMLMSQAFIALFLLIDVYREHSIQPAFQDKIWPLLGGLLMAHSCYLLISSNYTTARPNLFCMLSMCSLVVYGINVASGASLFYIVTGLGYHIFLLTFTVSILENAFCSREEYRTPPQA